MIKISSRLLFVILSVFFLFSNVATSESPFQSTIKFVSTDPQNQSSDLRKVSSAGESIIYIKGTTLFENFLDFQIYIADNQCQIQAYLSSPFQIACLAPSSKILGDKTIKVYTDNIALECPENLCVVSYTNTNTSSLKYIVPSVLRPNDVTKIGGKSPQNIKQQSRRTNQYFCNFAQSNSSDFTTNNIEFSQCTIENLPSGYYAASVQAVSKQQERVILDPAANNDFNVIIIPQITSLSKNKISSSGDELIISGQGFSNIPSQNQVSFENNDCSITFANSTVIKCELTAPKILNPTGLRPGRNGLRFQTTSYQKNIQNIDLTHFQPLLDLSTLEYISSNQSPTSKIIEGFFKAPATGTYTFSLAAMGQAQLYMSSAPLTKDGTSLVAEIHNGVDFREFSNPNESSQISKSLTLEEGEYYYLRILHLDDGNGYLTVGVNIPGNQKTFAPIPFELLFTVENVPQITVRTQGLLSSCSAGICDLTVIESTNAPLFSDFGLSYNMLSIFFQDASSLAFSDFEAIYFGNSEAVILSYDSTTGILSAFLPLSPSQNQPYLVAGRHTPKIIINNLGFAQATDSVQPLEVTPMIIQATAQEVGGDQNFIEFDVQGAYFGFSLTQSFNTIIDVGGVPCKVTQLENDHLKCITTDIITKGPFTMTVNGLSTQQILTFTDPTLLNHVHVEFDTDSQERLLNIQTTSNFDPTLATIIAIINNDDQTKTLTKCQLVSQKCVISQLMPGTYTLVVTQITSLDFFSQSSQTFDITFAIKSISPQVGSQQGKTLITLTGEGFFPTLTLNNQVLIGSSNLPCDITLTTSTTIQCTTNANTYNYIGAQSVSLVFKGKSVAQCFDKCTFTFSDDSTPVIQKLSSTVISPGAELTIFGLNFVKNPQVLIGSAFAAAVSQVSPKALTVQIPSNIFGLNLPLTVSDPVLGSWKISSQEISLITIKPSITDVSPKQGAASGTILTISGQGFDQSSRILIGESTDACEISTVTYNKIVCTTAKNAAGQVQVAQEGFTSTCPNCNFASSENLSPVVSKVTKTVTLNNQKAGSVGTLLMQIEGILSNDLTSIQVLLQGQASTLKTASLSMENNIISATFVNPPSDVYTLIVQVGGFIADYNSDLSTITILPVFDNVSSPFITGFLGGNDISITGSNFPSNIQDLKITIGGFQCSIKEIAFDQLKCTLPAFVSPSTQATYQLAVEHDLSKSSVHFSSDALRDSIGRALSLNQTNCFFGIDVGEPFVANITKILLNPTKDAAATIQGGIIQGSNNQKTYSNILELDFTIQEGLNTFNVAPDSTYRFIRFFQPYQQGSCDISELQIHGFLLNNQEDVGANGIISPQVEIEAFATDSTFQNWLTYRQDNTPLISKIDPEFASSLGGTAINLKGQILTSNVDDVQVSIDGINCQVTQVTATGITCLSGALPLPSQRSDPATGNIQVLIKSFGQAIVSPDAKFLYVDSWSDSDTWGAQGLPLEGDHINVPNTMNLLVDISPPKLGGVTVEGALIFDDKNIAFDCDYLLIQNGSLQIGSESKPIQNKITLTLHGTMLDQQLPIFGNKVIALNGGGLIDIHGYPRKLVSTTLAKTANLGDISILVQDALVDFTIGDTIVISTTSSAAPHETERKLITAVDGSQITLDSPLTFKHLSETVQIGTATDENIRVESSVALLSRNIVIKGDDSSEENSYGVYMSFLGDNNQVRISYTEIQNAGQAGFLGRFPLNFQGAGDQSKSYLKYNSVHDTYQRALTLTGTNYLTVQSNVIFNVQDHAIKIADGVSRFNKFENNLVIYQKDDHQDSAGFEINSPLNSIIANKIIGSTYGFRFSLGSTVEGGYSSIQTCSNAEKLGDFSQNTASSNLLDGLKINSYSPHTFPCKLDDATTNPPIQATFLDFLTYRNGETGVHAENLGAVQFDSFTILDHSQSGIKILKSNLGPLNSTTLTNSIIVGSTLLDGFDSKSSFRGIIIPDSDNLFIIGTTFVNFNKETENYAIDACYNCQNDLGARMIFTQNLEFINVARRVNFAGPRSAILRDLDGSLTKQTNGGWMVANLPHISKTSQCSFSPSLSNGLVCNSPIEITRLIFSSESAANITLTNFSDSEKMTTSIVATSNSNWATCFIAGSTYKIELAQPQELEISMDNSSIYLPITLALNLQQNISVLKENAQLQSLPALWDLSDPQTLKNYDFGDWYYSPADSYLYIAITGNHPGRLLIEQENSNTMEPFTRKWSNTTQWPKKSLPQKGDSVLIPSAWNMELDIDPPTLGTLTIEGKLSFDNSRDTSTLAAQKILVTGTLQAGTKNQPFDKVAIIDLVGKKSDSLLHVTGDIQLIGSSKNFRARLTKPAQSGSTQIQVEGDVSQWSKGDQILISPSDLRTIQSIQGNVITLDLPLEFSHSGSDSAYDTKSPLGEVDMRAQVLLITRNIRIQGSSSNFETKTLIESEGLIDLEYVSFNFCSAKTFETPALELNSILDPQRHARIEGNVLTNCLGWGVKFSQTENIDFVENIIYNVQEFALVIAENNHQLHIENNTILHVSSPSTYQDNSILTSALHFSGCATNKNISIHNNVASGCENICFSINLSQCKNKEFFQNNTAYESNIGFLACNELDTTTLSLQNLTAYNNIIGLATDSHAQNIILNHLKLTDNSNSILLYGPNVANFELKDSFLAGFTQEPADCTNNYGVVLGQSLLNSHDSCQSFSLGGMATLSNNYFANFKQSKCGNYTLFKIQDFPESIPLIAVKSSTTSGVDVDSLISFDTLIDSDQCNGFECTGVYNVILQDIDGSLTNTNSPTFITLNDVGAISSSCKFNSAIHGYVCDSENNFGILSFELSGSQTVYPIEISSNNGSFVNIISPLTLCKSVTRYTSIIEFGNSYHISLQGRSTPQTLNFALTGHESSTSSVSLKIKYDDVRVVSVINLETQARIGPYITLIEQRPTLKPSDSCGANLIDLEENYIEFKINTNCNHLAIHKFDSLVGYIRYDISPENFIESDGLSLFIQKLSTVLGVSRSQIRANKIQRGSTIVDFTVLTDNQGNENSEEELDKKLQTLRAATIKGEMLLLGASILDYSYKNIFADENQTPTIQTIGAAAHGVGFYFGMVVGPLIIVLILGIVAYRWNKNHRKNKTRVASEINLDQIITQTSADNISNKQTIKCSKQQVAPLSSISDTDRDIVDNPLTIQTLPTESDAGESEMETPRTDRGETPRDNINLLKKKFFQGLNPVLENNEEDEAHENNHS